jgi:hypothetical protein
MQRGSKKVLASSCHRRFDCGSRPIGTFQIEALLGGLRPISLTCNWERVSR